MSPAIRERLGIFLDIAGRPWFRVVGLIWFFVGAWDLTLSQFVPEEYSRNFPKLYQVVGMTAGWLSLWSWLMLGALLVAAGAVEWAFRHKKRYLELLHQAPIPGGDQANIRGVVGDQSLIGNPTSGGIESPPTIGSRDYNWQFDSQTASTIAARLRSRPEWQDKIIDVTPEYLWDLFHERTIMQGDKLAKPFLNKWMVICGPFGNVTSSLRVSFSSPDEPERVFMKFNNDWQDRLELIMPYQKIAVVGRIEYVTNYYLGLEDCELVQ